MRLPGVPSATSRRFIQSKPMLKKGPTVCEGVEWAGILEFPGWGVAPPKHDIKAKAEREIGFRAQPVERGNQAPARGFFVHAVKNGIEFEERIARKIHLGDQAGGKRGAEEGKVNVLWAPGVVMIFPRISARANGEEAVAAVVVGEG